MNLISRLPILFFHLMLIAPAPDTAAATCNNLFHCIERNDREGVLEYLRNGANPNAVNSFGNSPLGVAAAYGRREIAGVLVGHGAEVNFQNKSGETPLMKACQEIGHLETAAFLLQAGANPNLRKANGGTALITAAWYGHAAIVERLLQHRADAGLQDDLGETALNYALQRQKPDTALLLARAGQNLGAGDKRDGRFALFWAAREGYLDVIRALLDKGAPVRQATITGVTALHGAAFTGKADAVSLLLDRGAEVNARSVNGATPLHDAVGNLGAATVLLDRGAELNALDVRKDSPLLRAAASGHLPVVELLLSRGALMNLANERRETALLVSAGHHPAVALALLEKGADPNLADSEGRSALWPAIHNNNQSLVEALLRHKADPNVESRYAETPLLLAVRLRQAATVEKLIGAKANLEHITQNRATPLCVSIDEGQREIFEIFVRSGANVNTACYSASPVHVSVFRSDRAEFLVRLLELGANPELTDSSGYTALMSAVNGRNMEAVRLLLAKGANVNAKNQHHETPLKIALSQKNLELFQLLLAQQALRLADPVDAYGNTILHLTVYEKAQPFLDALLARGAPVEAKNSLGSTALLLAASGNFPEGVAKLIAAGADPNVSETATSPVALSEAIDRGHIQVIEALLRSPKIDVNRKDGAGYAPISYAIRRSQKEDWVPALLSRGATVRIVPAWAVNESKHTWILEDVGAVAPSAPAQGQRSAFVRTDPALFEHEATVEVRNRYVSGGGTFTRTFRTSTPDGATHVAVTDAELFQATGAKVNQNALELRYSVKTGFYEFSGSTERRLHIFQHRPILFLPGIFGSQIWVSDPSGYPEFPQAPVGSGLSAFPRLQCDLAGEGIHRPTKLDLFREYKFDSFLTRVYHKVDNREEVSFPSGYKKLYALPSETAPQEPQFQVPYFKVYPWPYDWRVRVEHGVRALLAGSPNRRPMDPVFAPYAEPPSVLEILRELRKDPVIGPFVTNKVVAAGHSTGGLLLRGAIKEPASRSLIDHAFFVNVPFFGAPKAYYVYMTGAMGIQIILDGQMRNLAPNCPIVHYLSPSRSYDDTVLETPYVKRSSYVEAGPFMKPFIKAAQERGLYPAEGDIDSWNNALDLAAARFHEKILGTPAIGWDKTTVFWSEKENRDSTPGALHMTDIAIIRRWVPGDETVPSISQKADFPEERLVEVLSHPEHAESPNEDQVWEHIMRTLK